MSFPKDDEYSIHQGSGCVNLDYFYIHQFVQNEEVVLKEQASEFSTFNLNRKHILAGSLTGTIYQITTTDKADKEGDELLAYFKADEHGDFKFYKKPADPDIPFVPSKTTLDLAEGEVKLAWDFSKKPEGKHICKGPQGCQCDGDWDKEICTMRIRIVMNYEYNAEAGKKET